MQTIIVEITTWEDSEAGAAALLEKLRRDIRVLTVKRVDQ